MQGTHTTEHHKQDHPWRAPEGREGQGMPLKHEAQNMGAATARRLIQWRSMSL